MAPKKAAKHAGKKTAPKKAAKKTAHGRSRDTRRCYEHFGRVATLLGLLSEEQRDLLLRLTALAQQLLRQHDAGDAADALRAAEHAAFGRLAAQAPVDGSLSETLRSALDETYTHMIQQAEQHITVGKLTGPVLTIYRSLLREASAAHNAGQFRAAVELARGAEAVSHVRAVLAGRLPTTDWDALEDFRDMNGRSLGEAKG